MQRSFDDNETLIERTISIKIIAHQCVGWTQQQRETRKQNDRKTANFKFIEIKSNFDEKLIDKGRKKIWDSMGNFCPLRKAVTDRICETVKKYYDKASCIYVSATDHVLKCDRANGNTTSTYEDTDYDGTDLMAFHVVAFMEPE